MNFNSHFRLEGRHAFLSASKYHWIRYTDERFIDYIRTASRASYGVQLHDLASKMIRLGVKLEDSNKTLNMYVNDAIGYHMTPEVLLYYSDNAFGTADAIWFGETEVEGKKQLLLRIHDLKTGTSRSSVDQLNVYAAFFCLEYNFVPGEIAMEFRIYKDDNVEIYEGDATEIAYIMSRIVTFDRMFNEQAKDGEL